MPEVDARVGANSLDEVLGDFDRLESQFRVLCDSTEVLIKTILEEEGIEVHSVQARVKGKEKLKSKYCKPDKDYKCLGDISDLVGLRVITYYSDKLDQISQIIGREFKQLTELEDKRIVAPNSFGYGAIHMDCAYSPERLAITEYRRFAKSRFEIQITTILGHAWAEMQHPWYDEFNSPTEEVRRFHRLAAVLELAEQEFLEIRNKKYARERSASVRVAAETPGTPVTPESLKALIEQSASVRDLDDKLLAIQGVGKAAKAGEKLLGIMATFVNAVGIGTIQELTDQLKIRSNDVEQFLARRWNNSKLTNPSSLPRGISILHLANYLSILRGIDEYTAISRKTGLAALEGEALTRQIALAREIDNAKAS